MCAIFAKTRTNWEITQKKVWIASNLVRASTSKRNQYIGEVWKVNAHTWGAHANINEVLAFSALDPSGTHHPSPCCSACGLTYRRGEQPAAHPDRRRDSVHDQVHLVHKREGPARRAVRRARLARGHAGEQQLCPPAPAVEYPRRARPSRRLERPTGRLHDHVGAARWAGDAEPLVSRPIYLICRRVRALSPAVNVRCVTHIRSTGCSEMASESDARRPRGGDHPTAVAVCNQRGLATTRKQASFTNPADRQSSTASVLPALS